MIPHRAFTIDTTQPFEDLVKEIQVVCKQLLPGWAGLYLNAIQVAPLDGGLTNCIFKVTPMGYVSDAPLPPVLFRIYGPGTSDFIDRDAEISMLTQLNREGGGGGCFGASVLGTFCNGRAELFISAAVTLTHLDLRQRHLARRIARRLRRLHECRVDVSDKEPVLWRQLDSYLEQARSVTFKDPEMQERLDRLDLSTLAGEVNALKKQCDRVASPVVFCHNDMTPGNILYDREKDVAGQDGLYFIDFEYAGYNYRGFDIANHFTEHAGYDLDWSLFPNEEAQRDFCIQYMSARDSSSHQDGFCIDKPISEVDLQAVLVEVNLFVLASHLSWSMWAILQARSFGISTFDYLTYTENRIAEYHRCKEKVFAMVTNIPKPGHLQDDLD